jgi:hypothetical protein
MQPLRRGDSRTLNISNLRQSNGVGASFQAGDVLRFTLKFRASDADEEALIRKTSVDGGVTFAIGGQTGTVNITAADWAATLPGAGAVPCYADLELTRASAGIVQTLWSDFVTVKMDATVTPL